MELADFYYSDKAKELKIDNKPNDVMTERCKLFLFHAVEPLETLFSPKVIIHHSGYRCPKLNDAVKGQTFSQHLRGNAWDFHVEGMTVEDAYRVILHSSLRWDQCILEGKAGHQWIHFSWNTDLEQGKQRMQALEIPNPHPK